MIGGQAAGHRLEVLLLAVGMYPCLGNFSGQLEKMQLAPQSGFGTSGVQWLFQSCLFSKQVGSAMTTSCICGRMIEGFRGYLLRMSLKRLPGF